MRMALLIILTMLCVSCAAPLSVEKLQSFDPAVKEIVLLNNTRWDAKLRLALSKQGFKPLRFATTTSVYSKGRGENEIATHHNEAEALYGLTLYTEQLDYCITNSGKKVNATIEISNLETNEIIMVVEKGGWTRSCGTHISKPTVFEDLSNALKANWK